MNQKSATFDFLHKIFPDYNAAVTQQDKKKTYHSVTLHQVIRINEVLSEL